MSNRRIFVTFTLIIVLLISITLLYKKIDTKKIYIEKDGMLLSISDGNGNPLSNVPTKDFYDVTVECTNGEGSWDYNNWKLVVKNITGNVTCDLTFGSVSTSQTLGQYIASLAGTTQGDGKVISENGYRYEGRDPNNYVLFNNELWRIIGAFGSNGHNSGSTYVKIMRNQSIGSYAWNGVANYANDWPNSTLYRLLNGCYYNALTGSNTTNISGSNVACSNYCIGYYSSSSIKPSTSCDFSVIGLQNDGLDVGYRDMVQSMTWYLGGPGKSGYTTYYPSNIYGYETNTSAIYSGRSTTATGYVGLLYASDYAYSVLATDCERGSYTLDNGTNVFTSYAYNGCASNSWIYEGLFEWSITPYSYESNEAFIIQSKINDYPAYMGMAVRPVVYLKSKTYKLSGTGTKTDPYIIGKGYEYENTFNYSANVQTLQIVKGGYYKFEVWGAAGGNGNNSTTYYGGLGGYATGVVHLNANDILYIHTGGAGKGSSSNGVQPGGTNGGGAGGYYRGGSGGGATDIRINTDSLYARVIVAGGGGGGAYRSNYFGGSGGGANGVEATGGDGSGYDTTYNAKGGGTTSGGAGGSYNGGNYKGSDGTFGNGGAAATSTTTNYGRSGGGGGGWYGGGGGGYRASRNYYYYGQSGGGGGSSYTYSAATASQVPSGWLLGSEYQMTSTSTNGGNSSDGLAKVTYCGQSASNCS